MVNGQAGYGPLNPRRKKTQAEKQAEHDKKIRKTKADEARKVRELKAKRGKADLARAKAKGTNPEHSELLGKIHINNRRIATIRAQEKLWRESQE